MSQDDKPPLKLSEEEIEKGRSEKGGFTKSQLEEWGVPWPAPSGWMKKLLRGEKIISNEEFETSASAANATDCLETKLLHRTVMAVIESGNGHLLMDVKGLSRYYGTEYPKVSDVIGGRPKHAIITGDISFDDKVYSFTCARATKTV